jgi:uncharacterized protein YjbI with pentapeptide repeats
VTARRDVRLEPPRLPNELLAQPLASGDGAEELELDGLRIEADGAAVAARSVGVVESELAGISFDAEQVRQIALRDSVLRTCDLSNVVTRKSSIRRVELRQSRLVGFAATEGDLQDVRVVGGTLMLGSFGHSRLERVVFEEVNLRDVSFVEARLDAVSFIDCELAGADFRGATLRTCVMRGTALDGVVGIDSLRGLTMPWPDVVASTAALADALGIHVEQD